MSTWSIQEQEASIKATTLSAGFISGLTGCMLFEELSTKWLQVTALSYFFEISILVCCVLFLRQAAKNPQLLSFGWRKREIYGNYQDEYLRSGFQQASTVAFQSTIIIAFVGYLFSDLIAKNGDPSWVFDKQFLLLSVFVGNLTFYLKLRQMFNDQDDQDEQPE